MRKNASQTSKGIADYLRSDDKLGALLPAVTRLGALQADCTAALPQFFGACMVANAEAGMVTVSAPNSAVAAKLKQQIPKLLDFLQRQGWQVNAIKIKVQARKPVERTIPEKQLAMPRTALSALHDLQQSLGDEPRNEALKDALKTLLRRHLQPK